MRLELLFLLAGAAAAPTLSPAPLALLSRRDEGGLKISCFAPRGYAGSTFELFAAGAGVPVRSVSAEPGQHRVEFNLDDAAAAARCYRCRYRSSNGSAWQPSAFSTEIVANASGDAGCRPPAAAPTGRPLPTSTTLRQDRSWLLPVAGGAAGLVLLLAAAAAAAWRVAAGRRRAKRRNAPCWTEPPCPTPEFSYDNCAHAAGAVSGAGRGSPRPPRVGFGGDAGASPRRDPRASPPAAAPRFSTFRSAP